MLRLMCAVLLLFQSTLPREERPDEFKSYIENEHFNPRSHERSDYFTPNKNRLTHVYFNPRSHERSDHCSLYHLSVLQLFQSTLPREERHGTGRRYDKRPCNFNPRSHERSDSNIAQKICLFLYNTDNKYIIR